MRPVVLEPWGREWEAEKEALAKQADKAKKTISEAATKRYNTFLERLHRFRVLDPACGSGNFLYLALRGLKDFEKRVIQEAEALGLPAPFPRVGPEAVLGIEVNSYAAELARATIWIGEIQWMIENGFGASRNPILKPLNQIENRDAVLNEDGTESVWPRADAIVGNPPFLGDKKMLAELGDSYTHLLRAAYEGRVPGGADLCCYWFEKARAEIEAQRSMKAGLVATNSIRGGKNRVVLQRIKQSADIYTAWSDEAWVNEGAAVRVSLVCFGDSNATAGRSLDGEEVAEVFADLTGAKPGSVGGIDLTRARPLAENSDVCFEGIKKYGPFDVEGSVARQWIVSAPNPHGRSNADVLRPWLNSMDLVRRSSDTWVVDFGSMNESDASLYESPFQHALEKVRPARKDDRNERTRNIWWQYERPRPDLRKRISKLRRYIATPVVAKHRIFAWVSSAALPSNLLDAVVREDDTSFGILHSSIHELWALRMCTWLGVGNDPRYTPTTTFETFPFPDGLTPNIAAEEYSADPRAMRIATVAKRLHELRENWLNPPELVDRTIEIVPGYPDRMIPRNASAEKELKKLTLTNLYNANPPWLQHVHRALDEAVAAAYGWSWPLTDDELLTKLFDLNQQRSGRLDLPPAGEHKSSPRERGPEKKHRRRKTHSD